MLVILVVSSGLKQLCDKEQETHPSPSFSRTSLNRTHESKGIVKPDVSTVWKAIVSEINIHLVGD